MSWIYHNEDMIMIVCNQIFRLNISFPESAELNKGVMKYRNKRAIYPWAFCK